MSMSDRYMWHTNKQGIYRLSEPVIRNAMTVRLGVTNR